MPETNLKCSECGENLYRFNHNSEWDSHQCRNWSCPAYLRPVQHVRIAPPKNRKGIDESFYHLAIGEKFEQE